MGDNRSPKDLLLITRPIEVTTNGDEFEAHGFSYMFMAVLFIGPFIKKPIYSVTWTEDTVVSDDQSVMWTDDNVVSDDKSVMWTEDTVVSDDKSVTWIDDNVVSDDKSVTWIDDNVISDDKSVMWTDDNGVSDDKSGTWTDDNVVSDDSGVSDDKSVMWTDDNVVSDDKSFMWTDGNVVSDDNGVSDDKFVTWIDDNVVSDDKSVTWTDDNVVSDDNGVSDDKSVMWTEDTVVSDDKSVTWTDDNVVSDDSGVSDDNNATQKTVSEASVCSMRITDDNGREKHVFRCCRVSSVDHVTCYLVAHDIWILIFQFAITTLSIILTLYFPLLIPKSLNVDVFTYIPGTSKFINIMTTRNPEFKNLTPRTLLVPYKKCQAMDTFRTLISEIPRDVVYTFQIKRIDFQAGFDRFIAENEPPFGVFRTLFDCLIKFKLRHSDPFEDCCTSRICGQCSCRACPEWQDVLRAVRTITIFAVLALPAVPRLYYLCTPHLHHPEEVNIMDEAGHIDDHTNSTTGTAIATVLSAVYVLHVVIVVVDGIFDRNLARLIAHRVLRILLGTCQRERKGQEEVGGRTFEVAFIVTIFAVFVVLAIGFNFLLHAASVVIIDMLVNIQLTMRILPVVILPVFYIRDTFGHVSSEYLSYHNIILGLIMADKMEAARDVAKNSPQNRENIVFEVCTQEDEHCFLGPTFLLKGGDLRMNTRSLGLLLHKDDTPYLSKKFFHQATGIDCRGAPGHISHSVIKAIFELSRVFLFLFCLLIIVMAYGDIGFISPEGRFFATFACGLIPFALKEFFFLKKTTVSIIDVKNLRFTTQFDDLQNTFRQAWPVHDIIPVADVDRARPTVISPSGSDGSASTSNVPVVESETQITAHKEIDLIVDLTGVKFADYGSV
ncbi:uncharacterized protein LOC125380957 [Haliotis rufescens]|uniref:uncharacterized protein LOC125380957 n=1 Tax=Haliotis rufescens TaxID=6454 RepID=UPI00201EBDC3|nr:uncharacterized protein LOC125380957 [Haliotis rufescens]